MWKAFLPKVKANFPVMVGFISVLMIGTASAQQHIIANKDNTRPEAAMIPLSPATNALTTFTATGFNGYNQVNWAGFNEQNVQRYILEYSINGTDFQTAGESNVTGSSYSLRHTTNSSEPMLYRVRMLLQNGSYSLSDAVMLEGIARSPVTVYPTIVSGNMINVNADWPVQQISIFSSEGAMVFSKNINGQRDFIPVAIPSLGKGMYWVTFYGKTWKTSSKILVP